MSQSSTDLPAIVLAVAVFGYPLVGNLVSILGIDSRVLSIPFRLLVIAISLWLLLVCRRMRLTKARIAMLLIWLAYTLRLAYDMVVARIDGADYALQFFLASCVLPALAVFTADEFQQHRFARFAFLLIVAGCAATLLGSLLGRFGESDLTTTTGRLSTVALNPVSLGHLAVSGVIIGMTSWATARGAARAGLIVGMILATACLVMTGSKGPALALIVCAAVWAASRGAFGRFLLLGLPVLGFVAFAPASPLAARLAGLGEDVSTLDRLLILRDSIEQGLDSPLYGSAFVELNSGLYPHNLFLDAILAFGFPLAIVFAVLVGIATIRALRCLRNGQELLGLLFFQSLIGGMLSGAIFAATGFWCLLALLLGPEFGVSRHGVQSAQQIGK
jgi:O-antigen ligase